MSINLQSTFCYLKPLHLLVRDIFLHNLSAPLDVANVGETWREAVDKARRTLSIYTPAKTGDRTIIDALAPFSDTLRPGEAFSIAVQHATEGAEKTRRMKASLGRGTVHVFDMYVRRGPATPSLDPDLHSTSAIQAS